MVWSEFLFGLVQFSQSCSVWFGLVRVVCLFLFCLDWSSLSNKSLFIGFVCFFLHCFFLHLFICLFVAFDVYLILFRLVKALKQVSAILRTVQSSSCTSLFAPTLHSHCYSNTTLFHLYWYPNTTATWFLLHCYLPPTYHTNQPYIYLHFLICSNTTFALLLQHYLHPLICPNTTAVWFWTTLFAPTIVQNQPYIYLHILIFPNNAYSHTHPTILLLQHSLDSSTLLLQHHCNLVLFALLFAPTTKSPIHLQALPYLLQSYLVPFALHWSKVYISILHKPTIPALP